MKAVFYERMDVLSATALAFAVVLAYSLWAASILHAQNRAGLSRNQAQSAVATTQ